MITKFTRAIADFYVEIGKISKEEKDIYEIGFEVILSTVITYSSIVIMGIVMHNIIGSIAYILCFTTLRCYCGGWHAKTRIRCWGVMCLGYMITHIFSCFSICSQIYIALMILSLIIFFVWTPIPDMMKKFQENELKKSKHISLLLIMGWTIISIAVFKLDKKLSNQILLTEIWVAILMMKALPWRCKNEKGNF